MDKIKSLSDLPTKKILITHIKEAMALNEKGIKKSSSKPKVEQVQTLDMPDYFKKCWMPTQKQKKFLKLNQHHLKRSI